MPTPSPSPSPLVTVLVHSPWLWPFLISLGLFWLLVMTGAWRKR